MASLSVSFVLAAWQVHQSPAMCRLQPSCCAPSGITASRLHDVALPPVESSVHAMLHRSKLRAAVAAPQTQTEVVLARVVDPSPAGRTAGRAGRGARAPGR
jgi:hypothetical protein